MVAVVLKRRDQGVRISARRKHRAMGHGYGLADVPGILRDEALTIL